MLVLAIDVINKAIVPFNSSSISLKFRQGTGPAKISLVQPVANSVPGRAQYEAYDDSEFDGLRVGIWSNSTGYQNDSDDSKLALTDQLGWQKDVTDPDAPFWYGTFDLSGQSMAEFIAGAKLKTAFFAVNLVKGAALEPILDQSGDTNCTVYAATDDGIGNGINMQTVPTLKLPCQLLDTTSGKLFSMSLNDTNDGILLTLLN